jgi:hypothetical protein
VEGDEDEKKFLHYKYPAMTKTQGSFKLHVSCLKHMWCCQCGAGAYMCGWVYIRHASLISVPTLRRTLHSLLS